MITRALASSVSASHGHSVKLGLVAMLISAAVSACSSSPNDSSPADAGSTDPNDICRAPATCPNDPPLPSWAIALCEHLRTDPACGSRYAEVVDCGRRNPTCSADGTSAGQPVSPACMPAVDAFAQCMHPDAGSAPGSCAQPEDAPSCALSMPVHGGLEGTMSARGCGTFAGLDAGTDISLGWDPDLPGENSMLLAIDAPRGLAPGQTGAIEVGALTISEVIDPDAGNATWRRWSTQPGACSMRIDTNVPCPNHLFTHRSIYTGHGSCTQPAQPQPGNSRAAVTIGDFTFTGFVNPS